MNKINKYIVIRNIKGIKGDYYPPTSKSHSFRALLLSLHSNDSKLVDILRSDDVDNFVDIINSLGFNTRRVNNILYIKKNNKNLFIRNKYNFKNSGTALRFMVTYLSLSKPYNKRVILDGDTQLKNRKIKDLLNSLKELGLEFGFTTSKEIPFYIDNYITSGVVNVYGKTSQFLSSLLLSLPFLKQKTIVNIHELNEKPYIDMTLYHLKRIGVNIENYDYKKMIVNPFDKLSNYEFKIPSDFSSATYIILASILAKGRVNIHGLDLNDSQGDKKIIEFLNYLGCKYHKDGDSLIFYGNVSKGGIFDMNDTPDMLPALVFFLVQYPYYYIFKNLESIRFKETDRVQVLCENLIAMGINVKFTKNSLAFTGSDQIEISSINAYDDHRIIMGASLLGMKKNKMVEIHNVKNLESSYPNYLNDISNLGVFVNMFHGEH